MGSWRLDGRGDEPEAIRGLTCFPENDGKEGEQGDADEAAFERMGQRQIFHGTGRINIQLFRRK